MKTRSATVFMLRFLPAAALLLLCSVASYPNGIAVLTPETNETSSRFHAALEDALDQNLEIIDRGLARNVLEVQAPENPYNMTVTQARNLGNGIGCSYFAVIKSGTLRRSSREKRGYYESYAAVYLVDTRTGRLVDWQLTKHEADSLENAVSGLIMAAPDAAARVELKRREHLSGDYKWDLVADQSGEQELGDGFRLPMPFRRIKPPYTESANLYGIEATVDVLVEIDKTGKVTGTRIERWAGFGLDESVEKTVREMNWRPADSRNGSFTMRVLLRYNFRDIADETK